jgi:hypothetical protein
MVSSDGQVTTAPARLGAWPGSDRSAAILAFCAAGRRLPCSRPVDADSGNGRLSHSPRPHIVNPLPNLLEEVDSSTRFVLYEI